MDNLKKNAEKLLLIEGILNERLKNHSLAKSKKKLTAI